MKRQNIIRFVALCLLLAGYAVPAKAQSEVDNVDSLRNCLKTQTDTERIKTLSTLVNALEYSHPQEAYSAAKEMLDLAIVAKAPRRIGRAYNALGLMFVQMGDYDKAIEYDYKSLGIYESIKDTESVAGSLINLSTAYKNKLDLKKSLELLSRALVLFSKKKSVLGMGYTYNNMATIYRDLKKDSLALVYFNKALALKLKSKIKKGLASTYNNIGLVQLDLKHYDLALENFEKSMSLNKEFNNRDGICMVQTNLGELETAKGNYKKAAAFLDSALWIAKDMKSRDNLVGVYETFHTLYKKSGEYEKALNIFDQYILYKDSALTESNSKQVAEMGVRYDTDKKDKEITLSKSKAEIDQIRLHKETVFIYGLVFILIGLLLLGLMLYGRFRLNRKVNASLSLVNHQIREQKNEITDSIRYARRIQESVLMRPERISEVLPQGLLLYKPRQIVSGDFYWVHTGKTETLVVVIDNVLHGVPGAFISLVGTNLLDRAVAENRTGDLQEMIRFVNEGISATLSQMKNAAALVSQLSYGVCRMRTGQKTMECYSTGVCICIVSDTTLLLGKGTTEMEGTKILQLKSGDQVFLFTNGYTNQLGGQEGKKFMLRNLETMLTSIAPKPAEEQKTQLESVLNDWKKNHAQEDDIVLIGFKAP